MKRSCSAVALAVALSCALVPASASAVSIDAFTASASSETGESAVGIRDAATSQLKTKFWQTDRWSAWTDHAGMAMTSGPAVDVWPGGGTDVFARGTGNMIWHKWFANGAWSGWSSRGGCSSTAPDSSLRKATGGLDLVTTGCDGQVKLMTWKPTPGWSAWESLGGQTTFAPAIVSATDGAIDIFITVTSGAVNQNHWNGSSWSGWTSIGGQLVGGPVATSETPGQVDVFGKNAAGTLMQRSWNSKAWSAWVVATGAGITPRSGGAVEHAGTYAPPSSAAGRAAFAQTAASGEFLAATCKRATVNPNTQLGLAFENARYVIEPGRPERQAFYGAIKCFKELSNQPLVLRTQVAIDAAGPFSGSDGSMRRQNLDAFIALVNEQRAQGVAVTPILTIRSVLNECANVAPASFPMIPSNSPCRYPDVGAYGTWAAGLVSYVDSRMGGALWGAWNEPDKSLFGLLREPPADLAPWVASYEADAAAERAGRYWQQLARVLGGPGRALAGGFVGAGDSSNYAGRRSAFLAGVRANASASLPSYEPTTWTAHPYLDFLHGRNFGYTNGVFGNGTAWLDEAGPALSNGKASTNLTSRTDPKTNDYQAQWWSGYRTRLALNRTGGMKLALYGLTPPPYLGPGNTQDLFDSAIADRSGRARPFICGLAELTGSQCVGSEKAQTTNVP